MKKLFRFFDDPISKFTHWYVNLAQKQMRKAIDSKYDNKVPNQVYWIPNTKEENLGLSEDKTEFITQRLTLSQCSYFIAHRLWAKMRYIMFPILAIIGLLSSYFLLNKSGGFQSEYYLNLSIGITLFFSLLIGFGGYMLAPFTAQLFLPNTAYTKDEITGVENTIRRCVVKDVDKSAPSDFKDRLRILDVDSEGRAVAGQILASDFEVSALVYEWVTTVGILFQIGLALAIPALIMISPIFGALAMIVFSYLLMPNLFLQNIFTIILFAVIIPLLVMAGLNAQVPIAGDHIEALNATSFWQWFIVIFGWISVCASIFREVSPLEERAFQLEQAVKQTGTEFLIDKVGRKYFSSLEEAKNAQLENVKNDKSHFIKLGTSTGLFAERRDPLAPTESGIDFGLSLKDIATHIFTIGGSGSGKTFGVIRPITHNWLAVDGGGLMVIDGKGALPLELKSDEYDYYLISPENTPFNPIEGMKPDAVADTLTSIFGGNSADPFWENSASLMIRMACIIIYNSSKAFTLNNILSLCISNNEERTAFFNDKKLAESMESPIVFGAFNYWDAEFPAMPEKTAGSIVNIVRTWLGNICSHEVLSSWVDTSDSVKVEDVFTGRKMGLLLPESEYGQGGIAISALVMRRLYDGAKKRGDNWNKDPNQKPVLLVADEIQNLLTQADIDNVAIARSLGLYLTFATQNIDGLYKRLDKDGAIQMLGNFASFIALPARTNDSNDYVSKRASKVWKAVVERFEGLPDARADINLYLESGADRNLRGIDLYNQAFIGHPRTSFLIGSYLENTNPQTGEVTEDWTHNNSASPTVNIKNESLVDPDELDTLLAKPHTAIALINRGRVQRRDVIQLGQ